MLREIRPLPSPSPRVQERGVVTVKKKIVVCRERAAYNSLLMITVEYTRRESPYDQHRKRAREGLFLHRNSTLFFLFH